MSEATRRRYFGLLICSIGVAFAVAGLTLWFASVRPRTDELNQAVLGIVVHVLFGYIVVMSGVVVTRSDLPIGQCAVAAKWCLGGTVFMGALVLWRAVPELRSGTLTIGTVNEFVLVGSVGAAAGVLVGLNRGQAVRNRRLASRREEREETLVFLLRLLEHDIKNHIVAISNHAEAIRPSTFDPSPTPTEAIDDRAESIERLLDTANVVLESETGDRSLERIDVAAVLRERVSVVRSGSPEVEVETDIHDRLYVEADQFVVEVFRNLLDNAVVHNDASSLTISVATSADDDGVTVEIADDGDGIPSEVREELFDPGVQGADSPGDGIGLYLVRKLIDGYGGSVSVSEGPAGGARFRVRLPRAAVDGDE